MQLTQQASHAALHFPRCRQASQRSTAVCVPRTFRSVRCGTWGFSQQGTLPIASPHQVSRCLIQLRAAKAQSRNNACSAAGSESDSAPVTPISDASRQDSSSDASSSATQPEAQVDSTPLQSAPADEAAADEAAAADQPEAQVDSCPVEFAPADEAAASAAANQPAAEVDSAPSTSAPAHQAAASALASQLSTDVHSITQRAAAQKQPPASEPSSQSAASASASASLPAASTAASQLVAETDGNPFKQVVIAMTAVWLSIQARFRAFAEAQQRKKLRRLCQAALEDPQNAQK